MRCVFKNSDRAIIALAERPGSAVSQARLSERISSCRSVSFLTSISSALSASERILNVQKGFVVSNCEDGGRDATAVGVGFAAFAFAALALAAAALLSAVALFDFESFVGDSTRSLANT